MKGLDIGYKNRFATLPQCPSGINFRVVGQLVDGVELSADFSLLMVLEELWLMQVSKDTLTHGNMSHFVFYFQNSFASKCHLVDYLKT